LEIVCELKRNLKIDSQKGEVVRRKRKQVIAPLAFETRTRGRGRSTEKGWTGGRQLSDKTEKKDLERNK